jgi:hypothetical protein
VRPEQTAPDESVGCFEQVFLVAEAEETIRDRSIPHLEDFRSNVPDNFCNIHKVTTTNLNEA